MTATTRCRPPGGPGAAPRSEFPTADPLCPEIAGEAPAALSPYRLVVLVAAAVCPCPPLLVPQVAAGAAPELDALRAACGAALDGVLAAAPDVLVLVGGGEQTVALGPGDSGSLAGFGVDLTVPLAPGARGGRSLLPPSLTVGAWLLSRSGWTGDTQGLSVAADTPSADCGGLGARLRALPGRVALLVLADGSAARSPKAPRAHHPRAEGFDAALADALARPDPAHLAGLDERLAVEVGCGGRAALAVLGQAAAASAWDARLLHHSAPYGVAYLVAGWSSR